MAISMLRPRSSNPEAPKIGMAASLLWVFGSLWLLGHPNRAFECAEMPGRDCWFMTSPWAFVVDGTVIVLLFPWWIARVITIPLGMVKASWLLGRLASVRFSSDRKGGAALGAAWALLRRKQADPALAAWVERAIAGCVPLRGAAIAAAGLARAAAGNRAGARTLLASVELLDPIVAPREARKLAREWLVIDAVADGDWRRAADIGEPLAPLPRTGATAFLAGAAARLAPRAPGSAPPVSARALVLRWLMSRQRLEGYALLRRALDAMPAPSQRGAGAAAEAAPLAPPAGTTALEQALGWHALLLQGRTAELSGARLDEMVVRLGRAWERALTDPTTRRRLAERSLALGVGGSDEALARTAEKVQDELAAWSLERRRALPADGGALVERAAAHVRDRLLGEVELSSQKLQGRIAERRSLPPLDEWREWLATKDVAERVQEICGWSAQKLAFAQLHPPVCDAGVWLWNERRERAIANAMFRWLHNEALAAGDAPAVDLERRNVAAGCQ